jgi:hypothetical protein
MSKHQILLFSNKNTKKNLNTLLLLYKQSNITTNVIPDRTIANSATGGYSFFTTDLSKDKVLYYNKNNIILQTTTENIKHRVLSSISTVDKKLSYINYLHERLWLISKLTYLNSKFYLNSDRRRMLFPDRIKKDSKNLLKKIYKNVRYKKENAEFTSY